MYSSARLMPPLKAVSPVDHQDLPVIAVVIMGGDKGLDGGKHFALNAKEIEAAWGSHGAG